MGSILAVGSQAAGNAGIRNQGGQAGLLGGPGAIDGSAQSFWNLADPANLTGNASSGHILSNILDPGNVLGQNQAANPLGQNGVNAANGGVPSVLPNLGAASMIPQMPQGGFMPLGQTNPMGGQTPGIFNQMAAQSAGQLFNPSIQVPSPQVPSPQIPSPIPFTSIGTTINTGGTPYSSIALPGGGGNPALGSPSGSALSRSQIFGGNVGPNGVTEPSDPAFLNNQHNGMMASIKAQYGNNPISSATSNVNPLISLNNPTSSLANLNTSTIPVHHIGLDPIGTVGPNGPFTGNSGTVPLINNPLPPQISQNLSNIGTNKALTLANLNTSTNPVSLNPALGKGAIVGNNSNVNNISKPKFQGNIHTKRY